MRFSKCWPRFQNYITQIPGDGDGAAARTLLRKKYRVLPMLLMVLQFFPAALKEITTTVLRYIYFNLPKYS